jgi:asparagine synthase (glutamine-hydrolysing)
MCGIAGLIDLSGQRPVPPGVLSAMASALIHRGPDEDGFLSVPGLGLASRRLSIVGLADGRQPIGNEDGSIQVVFNGEVFDYPEQRAALEQRGHRFRTHCDTEVLPHLWEEAGEETFQHLKGQSALALWDAPRQRLVLARDRFGICPLFWTRIAQGEGEWLLFASEIKALLASGMVQARLDPRGLDQIFHFYALPGPATCFAGVQTLLPGHCLAVQRGPEGTAARVSERTWWEIDFPDRGHEVDGDEERLVEQLAALMSRAVERRLRADVPVVAYLSGGIDSTLVAALAGRLHGLLPTFTIQIGDPHLDESVKAKHAGRRMGSVPVVVHCGTREILDAYPQLIRAAEAPVSDTCCAALLLLAQKVHKRGFKVALTGEGSDESLAGYPWYKIHRLLRGLDAVPGLHLGRWARRAVLATVARAGPVNGTSRVRHDGLPSPWAEVCRAEEILGGPTAWLDLYSLVALSRYHFYGQRLRESLIDYVPYADLGLNLARLRRWDPLNQSLYLGLRIHLPGLLLSLAGDRVAMNSSVETRYPFLDEDVVAFLARLAPRWKLRGLCDKYLLRRLTEHLSANGLRLPHALSRRPKTMFRAAYDLFFRPGAPTYVSQLLSEESLRRTDLFDVGRVQFWRHSLSRLRHGSARRFVVEIGLASVVATQMWYHTFVDGTLAELPSLARSWPQQSSPITASSAANGPCLELSAGEGSLASRRAVRRVC